MYTSKTAPLYPYRDVELEAFPGEGRTYSQMRFTAYKGTDGNDYYFCIMDDVRSSKVGFGIYTLDGMLVRYKNVDLTWSLGPVWYPYSGKMYVQTYDGNTGAWIDIENLSYTTISGTPSYGGNLRTSSILDEYIYMGGYSHPYNLGKTQCAQIVHPTKGSKVFSLPNLPESRSTSFFQTEVAGKFLFLHDKVDSKLWKMNDYNFTSAQALSIEKEYVVNHMAETSLLPLFTLKGTNQVICYADVLTGQVVDVKLYIMDIGDVNIELTQLLPNVDLSVIQTHRYFPPDSRYMMDNNIVLFSYVYSGKRYIRTIYL